ncbi:MAG: hypothetical protein HYV07_08715 [Deltaproteobacteria bacterium]|nr:hypothetical protein [Deltaproteobacteria bacterium]
MRIEGELVVAVGEVRGIDNPSLARSTATARAIASAATKLNGGRQVRVEGAVVTDRTECGGITFAEVRVPLKPKSEPEP